MEPTTFVGLDVHKRMTSVAIAESCRGGEVRFLGEVPSTPEALHRLVERLKGRHRQLSFCYEAGPCGYGVHRLLSGLGQHCSVVAPSLIPRRPGDRVKTNCSIGLNDYLRRSVTSPGEHSCACAIATVV
jgi:transposase